MSDYTVWKREEERLRQRKGLTGRGIIGCITLILSAALTYLAYYWITTVEKYPIRHKFQIPPEIPDWGVDVLAVLVLFVAIQTVFTLLASVLWKLAGKDKKVDDMMDDLLTQWDDIDMKG